MKKYKCKYCANDGVYSFGWLDLKGEWQDRHFTCGKHMEVSRLQQSLRMDLERMRERSIEFGAPRPIQFILSRP